MSDDTLYTRICVDGLYPLGRGSLKVFIQVSKCHDCGPL